MHSALQALGVHSQHIDFIWRTMLWVCGFMYLLVIAFLIFAIRRRRSAALTPPQSDSPTRGMSVALGGWTALMVLGLFGLALTSFLTDRALVHAAADPEVTLQVTAHQWWWQIEYT